MDLNELKRDVFLNAKKHGWHCKEFNNRHWLMLIITEISEAIQADRTFKRAEPIKFEQHLKSLKDSGDKNAFKTSFVWHIKDTFEDELADIVIRSLDLAGMRNIDLSDLPCDDPSIVDEFVNQEYFSLFAYDLVHMLNYCIDSYDQFNEHAFRHFLFFVLEYCEAKEIDIEWFVTKKMRYNESRPLRHGNKRY